MTNSNVPRQFWIDDDEYNECWYPHACDEKYDDEMIHVIEYSAYESLQAELAEVRAENDLLKTQYQPLVVANKETRVIVEELEAKAEKLVEALKHYEGITVSDENGLHKEGTEALTKVAREALKEWQS